MFDLTWPRGFQNISCQTYTYINQQENSLNSHIKNIAANSETFEHNSLNNIC